MSSRATLTDFGFDDVVSYLDPTEALGAITAAETSADLILLDIMMPEMDGIELCARIRGLDKWTDVPIIMLTSRKDMESLTEAFLAGANDYVTKPFERLELQARIRSSLRLKSELDRRQASDRRADAIAPARFTGAMSGAAPRHDVGLMCGQAGLLSSLLELPEDRVRTLGLAAFHVGRSDAGGDLGEDGPDLVRAAAASSAALRSPPATSSPIGTEASSASHRPPSPRPPSSSSRNGSSETSGRCRKRRSGAVGPGRPSLAQA